MKHILRVFVEFSGIVLEAHSSMHLIVKVFEKVINDFSKIIAKKRKRLIVGTVSLF